MPFNEAVAKLLLRSALDIASGQVGLYVPLGEVLRAAGMSEGEAAPTLAWLAERRWIYIRAGGLAISKWGLEFGMDWTHVGAVLRAILNSAGHIGRSARWEVVVAASGLPDREVLTLVNELAQLGLAGQCCDDNAANAAYITAGGWAYVEQWIGQRRSPMADALTAFTSCQPFLRLSKGAFGDGQNPTPLLS